VLIAEQKRIKNFSKIVVLGPKVAAGPAVKLQTPGNPAGVFELPPGANMTSNEVLSMYENIACLTGKMALAAEAGDWHGLGQLETRCVIESAAAASGLPALEGSQRVRKVELLRQIMANDRAIRTVTEPWMAQLQRVMATH
jgi:flagellar protein FliT